MAVGSLFPVGHKLWGVLACAIRLHWHSGGGSQPYSDSAYAGMNLALSVLAAGLSQS